MNSLITKAGKVVATVSDKHNVTVTEKNIVIELFTTTKTKTKFDLVKKPRRGRPAGSKNKTTKTITK